MREVERTHFVSGAKPRELFHIVTDYEQGNGRAEET